MGIIQLGKPKRGTHKIIETQVRTTREGETKVETTQNMEKYKCRSTRQRNLLLEKQDTGKHGNKVSE